MNSSGQLVDTDWLEQHLGDEDLLVCDCRFAGDHDASRLTYRSGHIPGAIHVYWLDDLSTADTTLTTFLPTAEEAAGALGRLGIGERTFVVGYADNANLYASRLWHVLTVFGHPQVALLDGGIEKWAAEDRPLETVDHPPAATTFRPRRGNDCAAPITAREIAARLNDPRMRIVDTRAPAEFSGRERRAGRGGHVPGAVLLPWDGNLSSDHTVLPPADIRARARAAGLSPDQEVVTYCQGGVRAAHTALALTLAGYPRIRVYDGSWAEWGNDPALPIETTAATA